MNEALTFDDVLIVPKFSDIKSRKNCNLRQEIRIGGGLSFHLDIPIIAANMDTICEIKMARKMADLGGLGILHRNLDLTTLDEFIHRLHDDNRTPVIAVGGVHTDKAKIDWLMDKGIIFCVDMAHGHSQNMKDTLEYICSKKVHPMIIAGNVCTPTGVMQVHAWGADIVKVGVGSGSVCTTRIKTGCGFPQLQALMNITEQLGGSIPIIADGGIRSPGDVTKCLAAGADFVMLGGMLAATDCTPQWEGEFEYKEENISGTRYFTGKKVIPFRGMASEAVKGHKTHVEGENVSLPAKSEGSTEAVINDICDGIRSAMSYVGAKDLKEFHNKSEFVRVTNAVHIENQPHKIYDVD